MNNTGTHTSTLGWSRRALLALPLLVSTAYAGNPGAEELWSDVRLNESFLDYAVTIGNNGSMLFSDTGFTSTNSRLYSTHRGTNGDPIWSRESSSMLSFNRSVASSEVGDIFAAVRHQGTSTSNRHARLDIFHSSSTVPIFSHDFSEIDSSVGANWCFVSNDGATVFAAFVKVGTTHLKRFDRSQSGNSYFQNGDWSLSTFDLAESFGISADLKLLYLGSNVKTQVFDLTASGAPYVFSKNLIGGAQPKGHSFSKDGSLIAIPMQDRIEVFIRSGNTYALDSSRYPFGTGTGQRAYRTALSGDGRTLAAAYYLSPNEQVVTVLAWDLTTGQELLRKQIGGSGQYSNRPEDLVISDDGLRLAVGLGGAEPGLVPGIVIYDRDLPGTTDFQQYASFDRPGSVINLDISADGYRLAVASKAVPQGTGFGEKVIEAINLGKDFDVRGNARQGNTVTFEFYPENPQPGTGAAYLLKASTLESDPLNYPFGTLFLKRQGVSFIWMGAVGSSGSAVKSLTVQGSVGSTTYYQGFGVPMRQLSRSYIPLTVLP